MTIAYLHVGMDKTGSTSLQRFLYSAAAHLLNQGFIYPTVEDPICGTLAKHTFLSSLLVAEDDLEYDMLQTFGGHERAFFFASDWIRRTVGANRGSGHKLILSSEAFYSLPFYGLINLRSLLRHLGYSDVVVLIFIDSAANRYRSQIARLIMSGHSICAPHAQEVAHYVRRLVSVFGRDAVKVIDFQAACRIGGTVQYGLDIMGIRRPERVVETRENISLSAEALHLIQTHCTAAVMPAPMLQDLRARVALLDLVVDRRRPLILKGEVSSAINGVSTDYLWLGEEYGFAVHEVLNRSPLPLVDSVTVPALFEFDVTRYSVMFEALKQSLDPVIVR